MLEVAPKLFCGSQQSFEEKVADAESATGVSAGWSVIHVCKEPYHRKLLGYTGRGAPKEHPEYQLAKRECRLYLNVVDTPDPKFFSQGVFTAALAFIHAELARGQNVLIHCNQGESRGPGLTLLYMAIAKLLPAGSLKEAEEAFKKLYPPYKPGTGVRGFLEQNWRWYVK